MRSCMGTAVLVCYICPWLLFGTPEQSDHGSCVAPKPEVLLPALQGVLAALALKKATLGSESTFRGRGGDSPWGATAAPPRLTPRLCGQQERALHLHPRPPSVGAALLCPRAGGLLPAAWGPFQVSLRALPVRCGRVPRDRTPARLAWS